MSLFDPQTLEHFIAQYGYGVVFLFVALESMGLPIPGETVLIVAAAFAGTTHRLEIGGVVAAAALGAIIGDNVGFWIGRKFGAKFLLRYGEKIGLDPRKLKLGEYLFKRYGGWIVFFGRFVAFFRAFAAILAGANRMAPTLFFLCNAAGAVVWASLFGYAAYYLGSEFHYLASRLSWLIMAAVFALLIAGLRFYKQNEQLLLDKAEAAMDADGAAV